MTVAKERTRRSDVIIRFAGDSGDGMQLTGDRFTSATASFGNDLSTLPDFPAEIRAPAGTLPGVSAFQIHFADHDIMTPGDAPDVLVAMNPAALKANLADLAMSDRATVLRSEAFAALGSSAGSGPFDLVLADPPYAFDQWAELIGALAAVVTPTGVVVAESDRDLEPAVAASRSTTGAGILRQRRYGGTVVTMLTFEWSPPVPPATASGDLSDQEPGS